MLRIACPNCGAFKTADAFMRKMRDTSDFTTPWRGEADCPDCGTKIYVDIGIVKPDVPKAEKTKGKK